MASRAPAFPEVDARSVVPNLAPVTISAAYRSFDIVPSPRPAYVACMPLGSAEYRQREAQRGVLYRVVEEHLERFLDAAAEHVLACTRCGGRLLFARVPD